MHVIIGSYLNPLLYCFYLHLKVFEMRWIFNVHIIVFKLINTLMFLLNCSLFLCSVWLVGWVPILYGNQRNTAKRINREFILEKRFHRFSFFFQAKRNGFNLVSLDSLSSFSDTSATIFFLLFFLSVTN